VNDEGTEINENKPYNHDFRPSFSELKTQDTEFFKSLL